MSVLSSFLDITPAQASNLLPYVRFYKVWNNKAKELEEREFDFPLEPRIHENHPDFDRGDGVGVKEFSWEYDGETPATASKYIKAKLTLYFQTFDDFVKKRFNVKVIPCKTIRYKNTFALSSRNKLLIKDDLYKLREIFLILKSFKLRLRKNFKYRYKISDIKNLIYKMGVKLEYLELRDEHTLSKNCKKSNFRIFISYYYKKIRFIDNI